MLLFARDCKHFFGPVTGKMVLSSAGINVIAKLCVDNLGDGRRRQLTKIGPEYPGRHSLWDYRFASGKFDPRVCAFDCVTLLIEWGLSQPVSKAIRVNSQAPALSSEIHIQDTA